MSVKAEYSEKLKQSAEEFLLRVFTNDSMGIQASDTVVCVAIAITNGLQYHQPHETITVTKNE